MSRRSVLFSPGDRPGMLRKAPTTGADVVVFDLEDAVAPSDRPAAREAVGEVLTDPTFAAPDAADGDDGDGASPDVEVCVRVSDEIDADLDAVLAGDPRLDALVLPKAESAADVRTLANAARARGVDLPVFALCETARGVLRAADVAGAAPTTALLVGLEDLAADVGAATSRGALPSHVRERVLLAARAAGVDAVDAVFTDVEDREGLRAVVVAARDLGYDGKMVIHPAQVPVVHDALAPDAGQLQWARRVVEAREERGAGAFRLDDEMIDAPLVRRAERILSRAGEAHERT